MSPIMRPSVKTKSILTELPIPSSRSAGMTLLEVVFALGIAAMISGGMYGSAVYTMRQTARNLENAYALQFVASGAAKVRAAKFDKITANNGDVGTGEHEKQFFSPKAVVSDPNHPVPQTFTLTYNKKGFGVGIVKKNDYWSILTLPVSSPNWETDEYKGHLLAITSGKGANQVAVITTHKNTVSASGKRTVEVKLASNLATVDPGPNTSKSWEVAPDSSSMYAVDYGMYCEVAVTWGDGTRGKSVSEVVYVPSS